MLADFVDGVRTAQVENGQVVVVPSALIKRLPQVRLCVPPWSEVFVLSHGIVTRVDVCGAPRSTM